MHSEEDLVRRAQRGDAEAFSLLCEAHFDKIYRYIALKVRNRADAEDLTQQAFMKATEAIGSYQWKGLPFASWLFRIAHNQVVDHFRKMSKGGEVPLDEAITVAPDDPVSVTEQRMTLAQLAAACDRLSEAQREVIYLRFGSELSIAETARVMGKREGAIKALQHDAVVKLRRIVFQDEIVK